MNCFYHPNEESTTFCEDCGKVLCKICTSRYEMSICRECNLKRNSIKRKMEHRQYAPSFVLFIIGFFAMLILSCINEERITQPFALRLLLCLCGGWIFGGTIWGWHITKTWFHPKVYINTGLSSNNFYHSAAQLVRIFLAIIVGIAAMPIGIIKIYISFIKA